MANHYLVRYAVTSDGRFAYPPETDGVVWTWLGYDAGTPSMVGETEHDLAADGERLVSLSEKEALELRESLRARAAENDRTLPEALTTTALSAGPPAARPR